MTQKIFKAQGGFLKTLAVNAKSLTADLLTQVMAGPPITAHADINPRILVLLITTTDENRGLSVRCCASRALKAAGWDFNLYTGPGTTHVVQHGEHAYIMRLTTPRLIKEAVVG